MRLGVDGWRLHGPLTGVGRYVSNILRHWAPDVLAGRFEEVTLYTPAPLDRSVVELPETIRERVVRPHWRKLAWENLRLVMAARDDVLFCPSYSAPLAKRCRTVVTIFEATQKLHPELYPRRTRLLYSPLYGWSARHATLVVTSSEAAGKDIVGAYGVDRERLRVVHLAASEAFHVLEGDPRVEEARRRYVGADRQFFLYVGKLTGRRNIPMLMRAFAEFKRRTSRPHALVLIGLNTTGVPVAKLAGELGIVADVRHYDHIDDNDLNLLYNASESFVLPYTYEAAFSLTALEAQVTGTPLITVDAPGLRESTGSAALLIPEAEVSKIAGAMTRLAGDAALRRELVERGLENAARFSWERASHETLDVLAEASRMYEPRT